MFTRKLLFCASLAFIAHVAPANAEILFRGTMIWTAVNSNCPGEGVGHVFGSQFHPRLPDGKEDFGGLTVIHNFGAAGHHVAGSGFSTSFAQVQGGGGGWPDYDFQFPAFVRISSQTPSAQTITTPSIRLTGQSRNPRSDMVNCIVAFSAS